MDSGVETGGAEGGGAAALGGAGVGLLAGVGVVAGAGVATGVEGGVDAGVGVAWDGAAGAVVESLEELPPPQALSAATKNRNVTLQNVLRAFEPYPMPPFHI